MTQAKGRKRLVINADDFGLLPEVNEAIMECFHAGSLTSATLMPSMPAARQAARMARENPGLGVGLHFTLTQGKPVSDPKEIPSLVDGEGRFFPRLSLEKKLAMGRVRPRDIQTELNGQAVHFLEMGLAMTHLDSHHHIHVYPRVFEAVMDYAAQNSLPLRIPRPTAAFLRPRPGLTALKGGIKKLVLALLARRARSRSQGKVISPDHFFSVYDFLPMPEPIARRQYEAMLDRAGEGLTEIMVHPARVTPKLAALFSETHVREQERTALTGFSLARVAENRGFEVISYANCRPVY